MGDTELLARIDERVKAILDHLEKLNGSVGDCKRRIGLLENWRSYILGGFAVVGVAVGIIMKVIF